jgi:hypothetical protein
VLLVVTHLKCDTVLADGSRLECDAVLLSVSSGVAVLVLQRHRNL